MANPLPIITDGIHGQPPINFYPAADSELGVILQPTPGLSEHCSLTGCSEIRGILNWNGYMYAVARRGSASAVWRVAGNGSFAEIGTINTSYTGPVWMVGSVSQLLIVDGVSGYIYTPGTGLFQQISDPDFPGAGTCDSQDGYGLFTQPNTREWFQSDLYDFSSIVATDFYVKEGKPDNIIALKSLLREVWIFGAESIEVWSNVGGNGITAPTFMRNAGGLLEYGLGAAASPQIVNSKMIWMSDKRQLLKAIAYQPQKISGQMMERAVKDFAAFDDAFAFTYTEANHDFYVITFPTGNETWVWDDSTQMLHKRQSYDGAGGWGRHRANCYTLYNNNHYVGDFNNGKIWHMSSNYYDDGGEEIRREFHMTPLYGGQKYIDFPPVEIKVKSGVGLSTGLDPQIMLQFSEDEGETWSNEVWRSAGKIGEYTRKAKWTQMGRSYWRMYKAVMTDPVLWQIQAIRHGESQ